jgi:hypothetical protein
MTSISSFTTINRDNIINLVQTADFFIRNPTLQVHADALQVCRQNYLEAKKKSSCGCGGVGKKMFTPCIEAMLAQLDAEKETNQQAIDDFVGYVTHQPVGGKNVKVVVYYTKNNGTQSQKYEFIA